MSVQALSCAFAIRGISSSEKLVLLALANFANDKMECWPSQERLAADTELSERTVWAALAKLETAGLLTREKRHRQDGTRTTDKFTLYFALTVTAEPPANAAKSTRKSCETQSQSLHEPVATVATLTTFEPSLREPSLEEGGARAPAPQVKRTASKRAPSDWTPSPESWATLEAEGYGSGQLERALSMVRDHEFRPPRSDWDATFRNWVRRDRPMKALNVHDLPRSPKHTATLENYQHSGAGAELAAAVLAARRNL